MAVDLAGLLSGGAQLASAYIPYEATAGVMGDIQGIADTFVPAANQLGQVAAEKAAFSPFAVRTSTGTTEIGEGGALTQNLSAPQASLQSGLTSASLGALGSYGQNIPNYSGVGNTALQSSLSTLQGVGAIDPYITSQQNAMGGLFGSQLNTFGLPQQTLSGLTSTALQGAQQELGTNVADVTGAYSGINAPSVNTQAGQAASDYYSAGSQALGQTSPTADSLYSQIRSMQSPEEERQRLELENRLAAQGRLGVSTSAYGGTPEQLAMEKAQAEARNTASFQATQIADQLATSAQNRAQQLTSMGLSADQVQSQLNSEGFNQAMALAGGNLSAQQVQSGLTTEQQNRASQLAQLGLTGTQASESMTAQQLANLQGIQANTIGASQAQQQLQAGNLGISSGLLGMSTQAAQMPSAIEAQQLANLQGLLGASYIPQQQQLATLTPALQASNIAQSGGLGESEALYKAGMQGLQSQAEATGAVAGLEAQRARALGDALQGLFAIEAGQTESAATSSINSLIDLFGG